jgi:hypothetical protein
MSLANQALSIAFREGLRQTSGSLHYNGESVSVVVGYLTSKTSELEDAGFDNGYGDLTVIARTSDVSSWNLIRDNIVGFVGQHYSGSLTVRDQIRYVGQFTWINLDRTR